MDSNNQYPTMWTTGWLKNGMKVSFTFPIRNEMMAHEEALTITNKLLADGFRLNEPGLEDGEQIERVGYIIRRKKENNDGTTTPIVDLYPTNDKTVYKFLSVYLNTDEEIKAFEEASGLMVNAGKMWPGDSAPQRDNKGAAEYFVKPRIDFRVVHGANPHYEEGGKKPKRVFVRWETATPQPPPPVPAAAAVGNPTPGERVQADAPRVTELRNEMLTITRIEPRSDSAGWYATGLIDGLETRVNLFAPEDVNAIKAAGYEFKAGNVEIPVVLRIQDNRLRIDTVTPKSAENAAKPIVSSFQTNLTQSGKPYLIFTVGDTIAYSFTREPFRAAGYNVDGWDMVGYHEMPTPAELVCEWDKQKKNLSVKSAIMVDQFAEKIAS